MQIIIVTSSISVSGGARQALYLAEGLQSHGHMVRLLAPEGSEVFSLTAGLASEVLPYGLRAANAKLRSLFKPGEPVVVHAFHNRAVKLIAYLGTWWRLQGLPVACVAHRGVTSRPGNPLPYLLPGIRAYLVNSHACARTLPLLWRRHRCHVVRNSLPEDRLARTCTPAEIRARLHIPEGRLVLGAVANDNPAKGFPLFLQAFARAWRDLPPATAVLVGATPEKWLPLCEELEIADQVRLVAATEHVADYMQAFDLLVFASHFIESQPNVILEGMALGLPIIASNVGGVPELLPKDFLFSPKNENALRAKLIEILTDPGKMRLSADCSLTLRGLFSTEERLRSVLRHYQAALAELGQAVALASA